MFSVNLHGCKGSWRQLSLYAADIATIDFIVTIPFSFIAEKWGVKTVLWCNLVPRVFMSAWAMVVGHYSDLLPTTAIIAGPFLNVLGGECVFQSTVFTLTSALTSEYVQRASYFSYISSTSYVVSFLGPTLASFTMSKNLWLPFWINIALLLCAIPTISTLPTTSTLPSISPEGVLQQSEEEAETLLESRDTSSNRYANAFETDPTILQNIMHALRKMRRLVIGRRSFQILLCSFFLTALASSDTKLLVQYISKRYEWTFAQAGYMLSAKALVNFTLLAIVVPRMIHTSISAKTAAHDSEVRFNIWGAEVSIAVSVIGVLCVAMAFKFWMLLTALIIYALGSALPVFTMSLVKSSLIALPHSDVQDFSIVMLTKTLGSLVGAPLMTVLWVQAIKFGGIGVGLPYFVSACIYLVAAFVIARLKN
ncbi:major facilitator superfamily transporter [Stemphylium lycopersici]|uniref:Major facilitator superfamily transporter n=1 Tax=Stemphylium lycopersici TaxID=183478 RepID=A0A364NEN0_STELY|nr:major facilitator superfamily transporter [Stemphylium lycopersici]RAR10982.1 major facilitator superfamily transporter [Stemphylium lycopersici]RAR15726.1 major facilitator superfamily transporter [Stemphylium lycopersici]